MNEPLTNAERRKQKSAAQRIKPSLKVGKAGVSAEFFAALEHELTHHELVKIRFDEFKDERKELAAKMAEKTASELIWIVGHVAVLFRKNRNPAA